MSPGFAGNPPAVAAVDWGTTRMRVWLVDKDGKVLAERRGDDGLITAQQKGFSTLLEGHLVAMGAPDALPVIICGMAGSRQGWLEAPYVSVPSPIGAILGGAARVPGQKRDIRIVPGLAQRLADAPDVMRGEETQLAGAGLPAATLLTYVAGAFEFITGICVLVGFQVRIVGWLLALFCVFTGIVFHLPTVNVPDFPAAANGWINGLNFVNFMKNLTLAGAYIMLATNGAGLYSLDARRGAYAAA